MNKSNFGKRLGAYILDAVIVSLIFSVLTMFIKESNNLINLNNQLNTISENFINKTITMKEYFNQYSSIEYLISKEMFLQNLFSLILMIGYFVILPYYYNGQTIGKKLMKIKIVKEDDKLTINDLALRSLLSNGIAMTFIELALIFLIKDTAYFITISILSFIQFLLVITSIFMILYRKDKKALHDIVCKTLVVDENLEVK
jgi:uncharacterized RDD family membrane protein YckC